MPSPSAATCTTTATVRKAGGGNCTSIQQCVNAIPGTAFTGDYCINVDSATYSEQVTIQGKNPNGFQLIIQTDPALISTVATVSPPIAFAAFQIRNASVTLLNMMVITTNSVSYGVWASSAYVTISSVNVIDIGGKITGAGMAISSNSVVSYSSITMQSVFGLPYAYGLQVSGRDNLVSRSTMTGSSDYSALYLAGAAFNTITQSYITNPVGIAVGLVGNCNYNTISQSAMMSDGPLSTALSLYGASSNTITQNYITSSAGNGASLVANSNYNTISQSTITSNGSGSSALLLSGDASVNTITQSYITNPAGYGAYLVTNSNYNTIRQSTMTSNGSGYSALLLSGTSSNTITQSYMINPAGYGAYLYNSNYNTISLSTMTSSAAWYAALYLFSASSNTILNSYVQGSTAGFVSGSTGTVINSSVFVATNTAGDALYLMGSVNLTVASSTLMSGSMGRGLVLNSGNNGVVSIGSVTVTGSARGLVISTQAAGFTLAVDSITFRGLTAGATAIHFLGGTFVSTITLANFEDAGVAVNVSGAALNPISRITMKTHYGTRTGPAYENDLAGLVDWPSSIPNPSQPSAPAGTALGVSSIAWTWAAATNAASYNIYQASGTLLGNVATTSYALTGLSTNTAYGIAIQAVNGSGNSALSSAATFYTQADTPGSLLAGSVSSNTVALTWTANTNPGGTIYEISRSSGAGYVTLSTMTVLTSTAIGLNTLTLYTFRVRALNGDSIGTVYVTTTITTQPPPPGSPGIPFGTVLGVSSITWTWAAATNAANYTVYQTTSPTSVVGSTSGLSLAQTGLSPNTTTSVFVQASNLSGTGVASSSGAALYTLANPPSGLASSAIQVTSATVSWSLNANPVLTMASVERSTDGASFTQVLVASATTFIDYSLSECTTYYYRARNSNGDGLATNYTAPIDFMTMTSTPLAPSALLAAPMPGNLIALSWTQSPSSGVVSYRLYYDAGTGTINYATPLAVVGSTTTDYTTGVLTSSAAYRFGLRASNRCGFQEANVNVVASAASLSSFSGVSAVIKVPASGKRIAGNRVTVMADIISGGAAQTAQVLFQYKLSASSSWTNIVPASAKHPNPTSAPPFFVHWDVTGLAGAQYDLRAVATDTLGNGDAAPASVTITVDPVNFDINEFVLVGGGIKKDQTANNGAPSTIVTGDSESSALTRVVLPAGALNTLTVTVSVVANPVGLPLPSAGLSAVNIGAQVMLSNGQSLLFGGLTAALTLSYPDADDDGIVDGTAFRADQLQIYTYDAVSSTWRQDFSSSVNLSSHTVTGRTPHFSTFALFVPLTTDLSTVRVYPVPYKPNGGNADQGVPFSAGNPNSGIIFDNLPASARIKVFTVTGQLVTSFGSDSTSGRLQWNVKNDQGHDVASGLYLAVISSSGHPTVTKKVLVVR